MKYKCALITALLLTQTTPVWAMLDEVEELRQSIQAISSKIPVSSGKKRVIVLGPTGSGKTTFIHGIADIPLEAKSSGIGRQVHPKQILPGFNVGHGVKVGTTLPQFWPDDSEEVEYWDCPGFGDPRGPKEDIINAFVIEKVFRNIPTKVVLVADETSLIVYRGTPFLELIKEVARLIPDQAQRESCLSGVITKHRDVDLEIRLPELKRDQELLTAEEAKPLVFFVSNPDRLTTLSYPTALGEFTVDKDILLKGIINSKYQDNLKIQPVIGESGKRLARKLEDKLNGDITSYLQSEASQKIIDKCIGHTEFSDFNINKSIKENIEDNIEKLKGNLEVTIGSLKALYDVNDSETFVEKFDNVINPDKIINSSVLEGYIENLIFLKKLNDEVIHKIEIGGWRDALQPMIAQLYDFKSDPVQVYLKSAEQGNVKAQYMVGAMYETGTGITLDEIKAREYYEKAAQQDYAAAQNALGYMFEKGKGEVAKDRVKAKEWYEKATQQDYVPAQYNLGRIYEEEAEEQYIAEKKDLTSLYEKGSYKPKLYLIKQSSLREEYKTFKELSAAFKLYEHAAKQGHAAAQNALGLMYESGKGIKKNDKLAVEWYQKAAEQGYVSAQYNLGRMYEEETSVGKNMLKAVKWYTKAAEEKYAPAQNSLGNLYLHGATGVNQDEAKAIGLYEIADAQEYAPAHYNLGMIYERGESIVEKIKARQYYKKAADKGDVLALHRLGVMYLQGIGGDKNEDEARFLFIAAANQGCYHSQYILGDIFKRGIGIKPDRDKAFNYYELAARQNYAPAQYRLGLMYLGVDSEAKAFKWCTKAAMQGYVDAQTQLGDLYRKKYKIYKSAIDAEKAINWYTEASKQEHAPAQYKLGKMHEKGQEMTEALECYEKAAENGYAPAQNALGVMCEKDSDTPGALKWYKKASKQNYSRAQYNLGLMYKNIGGKENVIKAFNLYTKAAEEYAAAQYALGCMYETGNEAIPNADPSVARKYYEVAAENGYAPAQNVLGLVCLDLGQFNKAKEWFVKAANAKQEHADAQYNLGLMYEKDSDTPEALKWYEKAAKQGHALAQYKLGEICETEAKVVPSSKAFEWYKKAAEQGHAPAQHELGIKYLNGDEGVPQDSYEALKWLKKAAAQGNVAAKNSLKDMYEKGTGAPIAPDKAIEWYKEGVAQGYEAAEYQLGDVYKKEGKFRTAKKWYESAADKKYEKAQHALGLMYQNQEKYQKAEIWYKEAAKINDPDEKGYLPSQVKLGVMYLNGAEGVDPDLVSAIECFVKAAEKNDHVLSQYNLGVIYETGKAGKKEIDKNPKEAKSWYNKVRTKLQSPPQTESTRKVIYAACNNLGIMYLNDYEVDKDPDTAKKAFSCFFDAANGDGDGNGGVTSAQIQVGDMYFHGTGTPANLKEAIGWYTKAAANHKEAQCILGNIFESRKPKEAIEWYRKAADQGYAPAQYKLGCMYLSGTGFDEKDAKKGAKYITDAANQNLGEAQLRLGKLYIYGEGVTQNKATASEWLRRAAAHGYDVNNLLQLLR